jgi:hypothetical protein
MRKTYYNPNGRKIRLYLVDLDKQLLSSILDQNKRYLAPGNQPCEHMFGTLYPIYVKNEGLAYCV